MSIWKNIESALRQHPLVRGFVVLGCEEGEKSNSGAAGLDKEGNAPKSKVKTRKSDPGIVAYVVSNQTMVATTDELHSHVKRTLPDFKEPAKFVFLSSLPVMPNGIVDSVRLGTMNQPERNLPQVYVAPRTVNEQLMANICQEPLK